MPLFTRENAREMAAKGNAIRWSRPQFPEHPPRLTEADPFPEETLSRVRRQLDMINEALTTALQEKKIDPNAIDRLASAQSRLSEQERVLAGRPMPGSLRPTKERPKRNSHPDPEPTPEPVQECAKVVPPDVVPSVIPASHDPNAPNG